jgi:hypothetical protein
LNYIVILGNKKRSHTHQLMLCEEKERYKKLYRCEEHLVGLIAWASDHRGSKHMIWWMMENSPFFLLSFHLCEYTYK